jgi:CheY-like chemotaxis protein/anti-sigma regulatory factor (Ser/Thr protein kinase)
MNYLLIVDDSPLDSHLARSILEKQFHERIKFAANGWEALEQIEEQLPLVVITDLQLPELDGLQLTERIHQRFPTVPVLLMTAHGSEEIAAEALARGAVDYVPKSMLAAELCHAVSSVLAMSTIGPRDHSIQQFVRRAELQLELDNDPARIAPVVSHLQDLSRQMGLVMETQSLRMAKALTETLRNAIFHGNLELTAEEWDVVRAAPAESESVKRRLANPEFAQRQVIVTASISPYVGQFSIRDEGRGFDIQSILNSSRDPSQLSSSQRRGLVLIQAFCDEVHSNRRGNEITLIKRRSVDVAAS